MDMFLPLSRMARRFLLSNSNCTISKKKKKKKQQPNKANTIEKKKKILKFVFPTSIIP